MSVSTFLFFLAIVVGTLLITYWAAKQTASTRDYYTAGGQLTGLQNGLAIAGDYISAASFLGITGTIAFYGFDGFLYAIGFLASYLVLLLLVAEPVRNLGTFTLADVVCARFPLLSLRLLLGLSTVFISILYMVAQLVAAGLLLNLLLGAPYSASVLAVGLLMTLYVVFGGMMATSWVQIVKAVLLVTGTAMVCLIILARIGWDLAALLAYASRATPWGEAFLNPRNLFARPLDLLSFSLALVLGTAGLPHILVRCLTVRDAPTARRSVLTATLVVGSFYLMTALLGIGAVRFVGWNALKDADPTGNLTVPLLAQVLGGDFLMAFVAAIAFATILAVVCGVVIAASSSFAHDVYGHVLRRGAVSDAAQMRVARGAAVGVAFIAILLALQFRDANAAGLVALIFSLAASAHFPVLVLTLYWRPLTARGATWCLLAGTLAPIAFVVLSSRSGYPVFRDAAAPLLSPTNPALFTVPLSFAVAYIGSRLFPSLADANRYTRILAQLHLGPAPPPAPNGAARPERYGQSEVAETRQNGMLKGEPSAGDEGKQP